MSWQDNSGHLTTAGGDGGRRLFLVSFLRVPRLSIVKDWMPICKTVTTESNISCLFLLLLDLVLASCHDYVSHCSVYKRPSLNTSSVFVALPALPASPLKIHGHSANYNLDYVGPLKLILETACFEYSMWIYDLWPSIHLCGVHEAQCISGGRVSLLCVFTFLRMEWGKCTEVTKREINCTIGYQDPGDGRLRRNKTTQRKRLMNTGAAFYSHLLGF